jgi:hypothetical protein
MKFILKILAFPFWLIWVFLLMILGFLLMMTSFMDKNCDEDYNEILKSEFDDLTKWF